MKTSLRLLIALVAIAALALPASASAAKKKPKTTYYVSLGDSWAQGVQPIGPGQADVATKKGFVNYAFKRLRKRHPGLKLIQLGCGGATTDSMINGTKRCVEKLPYKSKSKKTSQLTYAKKWIRKHRKRVRYVSVIIGGNDIAPCASKGDNGAIIACVGHGIQQIKKNTKVIAKAIRSAGGKKPEIVGSTYADVVLGQWVKSENGKTLARLSVGIFRDQLNPTFKKAYSRRKIKFVDATAGFGAYIPFEQTTTMQPYGEIPVAVANICRLGWYCNARPAGPDIHLKSKGYAKLGRMVLKKFKR
jgi:lysophospholipase L1-like esterase